MVNYIGSIIALALGTIVTTTVLIPQIKAVNITEWTPANISLLATSSLVALMGLIYGVASSFGLLDGNEELDYEEDKGSEMNCTDNAFMDRSFYGASSNDEKQEDEDEDEDEIYGNEWGI